MLAVAYFPQFGNYEDQIVENTLYIVLFLIGGYTITDSFKFWLARPGSIQIVQGALQQGIDMVESATHVDIPDTLEDAAVATAGTELQKLAKSEGNKHPGG